MEIYNLINAYVEVSCEIKKMEKKLTFSEENYNDELANEFVKSQINADDMWGKIREKIDSLDLNELLNVQDIIYKNIIFLSEKCRKKENKTGDNEKNAIMLKIYYDIDKYLENQIPKVFGI